MNSDREYLSQYVSRLPKLPYNTLEQDLVLARKLAEGEDVEACVEALTVPNLRFAAKIASRYVGKNSSVEDLISWANEGLIRGVERYDFKKGTKFITGAYWSIRGNILLHMGSMSGPITIPKHASEKLVSNLNLVDMALAEGEIALDRRIEDLLASEVLREEEARVLRNHYKPIAQIADRDSEEEFRNTVFLSSIDERLSTIHESLELRGLFSRLVREAGLSEVEKAVLDLRNGLSSEVNEDLTQREVGEIVGYTFQGVSLVEKRVIRKLQETARKLGIISPWSERQIAFVPS